MSILTKGLGAKTLITKGYGTSYVSEVVERYQQGGGSPGGYIGGTRPVASVQDTRKYIIKNILLEQEVTNLVYRPYINSQECSHSLIKSTIDSQLLQVHTVRLITSNDTIGCLVKKRFSDSLEVSSQVSKRIKNINSVQYQINRNILENKEITSLLTLNVSGETSVISKTKNNLLRYLLLDDDLLIMELLRRKK